MRGVEERCISISHLYSKAHHFQRYWLGRLRQVLASGEQCDSLLRPYCPMPKQSADDSTLNHFSIPAKSERSQQILHNIIVVTRIKRDVIATRLDDSSNHIKSLIAVERSDFYRHNIFNFGESPPKRKWKKAAAGSGLKIEAYERKFAGDDTAVFQQRVFSGILQGR